MTELTETQLRTALSAVHDPDRKKDVVSLGYVKDITLCGGAVKVVLQLDTPPRPAGEAMRREAMELLAGIKGVETATVELRAMAPEASPPEEAPSALAGQDIKQVIAVTSGKGGVGKSTCAVNLAAALTARGFKVGLMDADIYGPNIPVMMGLEGKPEMTAQKKIVPKEAHGIKTISIGYLLEDGTPVMWRGPMLHKALEQFLKDVDWGPLDYLLVDMPPGTGDAQISLAQLVPLTGAVVVTMPQEVSLTDVRRAIGMCQQVKCDVLGVLENMSGDVFGSGGGAQTAEAFAVPFLGSVPLAPELRLAGDAGVPEVIQNPESSSSKAFSNAADGLLESISKRESLILPVLQ